MQDECAVRVRLAGPACWDPGRRTRELEKFRAYDITAIRAGELELRALPNLSRAHRHQLDLAFPLGKAVALLVRAVKRLCEVFLQRQGQLERLARVAEIGRASCRERV